MALSEELPLYKDSYDLFLMVIESVKSYPRFYRYTLGERMVTLNMEMLSLIYKANSSYEKASVIADFLDKYRMLVMLFRVIVEQHIITERQYARYAFLLQKVGKQATSWKQYSEKKRDERVGSNQ